MTDELTKFVEKRVEPLGVDVVKEFLFQLYRESKEAKQRGEDLDINRKFILAKVLSQTRIMMIGKIDPSMMRA
ncbi:MAG: hypothetical protein A3H57_00510 [Candidatus Taylorbacteria bacterium RIFCSPLOWO2_02_FULL_43_11]|uniref:Uncharacterized protein n=1 Tax=Candidatus Taylorbacteria bacterium RIFCSPHIGHO2_02_FULL_43_32b TaxID=1802306 RepID=A0A1G2MMH7_9BACT|nr:MAG: hypothetical protein A2743_02770 [Candidatus Taylorbacteria bacterium RIFCSPHIGHO2_01_FULL_43_47]OHA25053.1 MAG: hypothetical protein A3C72_03910 [Candidatus Taylorbacteria bacterium RIFCSPHIGHO2_02_FULL_43_32b]OHA31923.1 MAG: hypothetical protein A3B08_02410 [Candidatus Taylorbacteria bacterium RIFCSPLOWO2_01_FULL_43_44]OHA35775.1 MAG: hypothetical protein A3H57_00510 [Candidatus Taylorbacteria bacterium RIFCSPLOWO2_02_FULL_43_11]